LEAALVEVKLELANEQQKHAALVAEVKQARLEVVGPCNWSRRAV